MITYRWPNVASILFAGFFPAVSLCTPAVAQSISDFKLITPDAGWVVAGNNLLWTDSAGSAWSNITPSAPKGGPIHGVFFLNTTSGWVLLTEPTTSDTPAGQLQLAKTDDTGRSWSATSFRVDTDDLAAFAGDARIFFADALHGWIMLKVISSSNFKFGLLFATSDGGGTWTKLPPPPIGEPVYFVTATDGWLAGGPNGDALFVTRNGGHTWSKQQLPAPASSDHPSSVTYSLPRFATVNDGLIKVTFASEERVLTTLYESHDRGAKWKVVQAHRSSASAKDRPALMSSLLDKKLIILSGPRPTALTVVDVSAIRTRATGAIEDLSEGDVTDISFGDEKTGWLLVSRGHCAAFKTGCNQQNRLIVTQDGAQSFQDVTPDLAILGLVVEPHASLTIPPGQSSHEASSSKEAFSSSAQAQYSAASVMTIQNKQGFDKCGIPTVSQMQTWWNSSPYRAVAFYIGGVWRSCGNTSLNSAWVSSVSAMGWGLIPIWVGPQANTSRFSTNLVNTVLSSASQQGRDQASAASDQASNLGLTPSTTIYYDMEAATNPTFRSAVQAFLDGWVQGMHARQNKAGVYSSHPEFQYWTPTYIANVADAIWFAYFFSDGRCLTGTTCQTIFDVPDISNSLWTNDQRIRQTSSTIDKCWGSVCFTGNGGIDEDWVDAQVANIGASGGQPTITTSLRVSPNGPYVVGQTLSTQFSITNRGSTSFTFQSLLVGGRLNNDDSCSGGCPDFTTISNVTLSPGQSYNYQGTQTITRAGNYHFFTAYQRTDNGWNTNIPADSGVTNTVDLSVVLIDNTSPTITITSPVSSSSYSTSSSTINLGGTASDNVSVTQVTWSNNRGGSGTASGTINWTVNGVGLQSGLNNITLTARDAAGNQGMANIAVTYATTDPIISALANTTQPVSWFYFNNASTGWYIANPGGTVYYLVGGDSTVQGQLIWKPIQNAPAFLGLYPAAGVNLSYVNVASDGRSVGFGSANGSMSSDPLVGKIATTTQPVSWFYFDNPSTGWYIANTAGTVYYLVGGDKTVQGQLIWKPVQNAPAFLNLYPAAGANFSYVTVSGDGRSVSFGPLK